MSCILKNDILVVVGSQHSLSYPTLEISDGVCKLYTIQALLNPAHALHGGVSYFVFVCLSVCVCPLPKYLKKYWTNFIFGEGLSSDPGRKPFDFEKNCPGVRVGLGGSKFGPNDKR